MVEDFYKSKSKVAKKALRALRAQVSEEKEALRLKLDTLERERYDSAEKIDRYVRKWKRKMVYGPVRNAHSPVAKAEPLKHLSSR
jgi:Arc/MetJ-type ribon-helix-helix transcriptional regulator